MGNRVGLIFAVNVFGIFLFGVKGDIVFGVVVVLRETEGVETAGRYRLVESKGVDLFFKLLVFFAESVDDFGEFVVVFELFFLFGSWVFGGFADCDMLSVFVGLNLLKGLVFVLELRDHFFKSLNLIFVLLHQFRVFSENVFNLLSIHCLELRLFPAQLLPVKIQAGLFF